MPRPPTHTHPPTHAPTNLMPPSPQVLPLCYAAKQYDTTGHVTNSMLVSVALLEIYVFKVCMGGGWVRWLGVCSSRAPARTHAPARLHRASLHDAPAPSAPTPNCSRGLSPRSSASSDVRRVSAGGRRATSLRAAASSRRPRTPVANREGIVC